MSVPCAVHAACPPVREVPSTDAAFSALVHLVEALVLAPANVDTGADVASPAAWAAAALRLASHASPAVPVLAGLSREDSEE